MFTGMRSRRDDGEKWTAGEFWQAGAGRRVARTCQNLFSLYHPAHADRPAFEKSFGHNYHTLRRTG